MGIPNSIALVSFSALLVCGIALSNCRERPKPELARAKPAVPSASAATATATRKPLAPLRVAYALTLDGRPVEPGEVNLAIADALVIYGFEPTQSGPDTPSLAIVAKASSLGAQYHVVGFAKTGWTTSGTLQVKNAGGTSTERQIRAEVPPLPKSELLNGRGNKQELAGEAELTHRWLEHTASMLHEQLLIALARTFGPDPLVRAAKAERVPVAPLRFRRSRSQLILNNFDSMMRALIAVADPKTGIDAGIALIEKTDQELQSGTGRQVSPKRRALLQDLLDSPGLGPVFRESAELADTKKALLWRKENGQGTERSSAEALLGLLPN